MALSFVDVSTGSPTSRRSPAATQVRDRMIAMGFDNSSTPPGELDEDRDGLADGRGHNSANPIGPINTAQAKSTSVTVPGLAGSDRGSSWAFAVYAHRQTAAFATPSGVTERFDQPDGTTCRAGTDAAAGVTSFTGDTLAADTNAKRRSDGSAPVLGANSASATGSWSFTGSASGLQGQLRLGDSHTSLVGQRLRDDPAPGTAAGTHGWTGTAAGRPRRSAAPRAHTPGRAPRAPHARPRARRPGRTPGPERPRAVRRSPSRTAASPTPQCATPRPPLKLDSRPRPPTYVLSSLN